MKLFCLLICVLVACGCDAFDEGRLEAQRFDAKHVQDANTGDDTGDSEGKPASPDDADDSIGEGPEPDVRLDASAGDGDAPTAPELASCEDDDAGAASDVDSDRDGILDCDDRCPLDPAKDSPGSCGCGVADRASDGVLSCQALRSSLAHRFRFNGQGTALVDERAGAAGAITNATLGGQGSLTLAGGTSDQYVDLPNGLISSFTSVTIEAWVTWAGGEDWQRIFDFGSSDATEEGVNGIGATYLMLSPRINDRSIGAAYANAGPSSAVFVESAESLPIGTMTHVALVFDGDNDQMKLYFDGRLVGGAVVEGELSAIDDRNNWLGRSQYEHDAGFGGALHEFRIYDRALSAEELALSHAYGTDPSFLSTAN